MRRDGWRSPNTHDRPHENFTHWRYTSRETSPPFLPPFRPRPTSPTRPSMMSIVASCPRPDRTAATRRAATALELGLALPLVCSLAVAVVLVHGPDGRRLVASVGDRGDRLLPSHDWQTMLGRLSQDIHGCLQCVAPMDACGTKNWWATEISVDDAETLAASPSAIFIRRATAIDGPTARVLGRSTALIVFEALDALSCDAAAGLAGHAAGIRLDAVVTLEPDAARSLGSCRGPLSLNGLPSLDADVARGLAAHRGHLSLNGVEQLTPQAAALLATHDGEVCLNGLTSISAPVAAALARHRHRLNLNGLETLDADVATALAGFRGSLLSLDGVTQLADEADEALHQVPGFSLLRFERRPPPP